MNRQRWLGLSLRDQIGHITSEIARARVWEEKDDSGNRDGALERALELAGLTLGGYHGTRLRELARFKEMIAHCLARSNFYEVTLSDLERFGLSFLL
jgi:hypothetical protein